MTPLNDIRCELGEGAFWHPERQEFFWFDILGGKLHRRDQSWDLGEMASAMGWVDADRAVIATETRLALFDYASGSLRTLCALDAENPVTRSNDGRADPQGGFWIGTMGKRAEKGAGAIWRWKGGELRCLFPQITIPNAISFAPDGQSACFTDTVTGKVMRVALDTEGWPSGMPVCWLDLAPEGLNPDGAVFDADGNFWLAQWGAARVACYAPDGQLQQSVAFPAPHTSCPAFGGPDLRDLYCTTAREGRESPTPLDGATFCAKGIAQGQPEHRVIL
ncbi:SMP-30/gluconolactonase/LRE family protein [Natronohydrobacter thiooxidans]|uniref:SMP-30/gluconolactonase/LRE family protein n=1 Tax=Natronohydrobacter thiooxidans TaxID=87172 RepID=UPI0008FF42A2|nr:SMP-30/gluconolactonase/LRE family protein [Natronohydrobacter thiooxidans]